MAIALVRSESCENLPESTHETPEVIGLRNSAAQTGEAVTRVGCGVTQIAISGALMGTGMAGVAVPVGIGLKGSEEVTVVGSKAITESGFVDEGLRNTQIQVNRCTIL